ncbi:hypothetical protein [Clostridium cylindrosporum]|uniref:Uncharacterized protein n=1 Tax=Clostridium cylindrosporum DSM 605 TaxID=1121307 RepID=A0A0J8DDH8_CLOCY|nr:hypothetical protein [Clostridium cylindrosporum]KMT22289.1 hypothetical protein CLCY_4c02620 [Clostridium cylindrosporum DSM 605]
MAKINYENGIIVDPVCCGNIHVPDVNIPVRSEVKVFGRKFGFWEGEEEEECADNGDDIGFILVFGNFSNSKFVATSQPTVEDKFVVPSGVTLRVRDLSLPPCFEIGEVSQCTQGSFIPLAPGTVLTEGTHKLRVRYRDQSKFDLPPHSVASIALLFEVIVC